MGRPINKRFIGEGAGKVEVSRYFFTGASEVKSTATPAYIVSQRSSRRYKVSDGTTTETLTLVNQEDGDLSAGEFAIDAILDDSTVVQVTKLHNRTISYEQANIDLLAEDTNDSVASAQIKYNLGEEDDDLPGTATLPQQ
jgi:hypothetical protein